MRVELGALARRGLELHLGGDLQAGVRIALADYLAAVEGGQARPDAPRFDCSPGTEIPGRPLEVSVDPASQTALEREAARQGITLSHLAAHSVYLYLARRELA